MAPSNNCPQLASDARTPGGGEPLKDGEQLHRTEEESSPGLHSQEGEEGYGVRRAGELGECGHAEDRSRNESREPRKNNPRIGRDSFGSR